MPHVELRAGHINWGTETTTSSGAGGVVVVRVDKQDAAIVHRTRRREGNPEGRRWV